MLMTDVLTLSGAVSGRWRPAAVTDGFLSGLFWAELCFPYIDVHRCSTMRQGRTASLSAMSAMDYSRQGDGHGFSCLATRRVLHSSIFNHEVGSMGVEGTRRLNLKACANASWGFSTS